MEGCHVERLVGLLLAVLVLGCPAPAHASKPVSGGRYVSHVNAKGGASLDVVLTLANDGKEFAAFSYAWATGIVCGSPNVTTGGALSLNSDDSYQLRSVQVQADGSFRHREGHSWIRGRFVRHGRVAIGSVILPGGGPCSRVSLKFRARLIARPNAARPGEPSRCDRVFVGDRDRNPDRIDAAYGVREQGVGCTTARELARLWHGNPLCTALVSSAACKVLGADCQTIRGGTFTAQASARCVPAAAPGGTLELVRLLPCEPLPEQSEAVELWTVNLDCETARNVPFTKRGERCGRLVPRTRCERIAGYTCSLRDGDAEVPIVLGRCVLDQDPFLAFEYELDLELLD
jgi:hypothetical protein